MARENAISALVCASAMLAFQDVHASTKSVPLLIVRVRGPVIIKLVDASVTSLGLALLARSAVAQEKMGGAAKMEFAMVELDDACATLRGLEPDVMRKNVWRHKPRAL